MGRYVGDRRGVWLPKGVASEPDWLLLGLTVVLVAAVVGAALGVVLSYAMGRLP